MSDRRSVRRGRAFYEELLARREREGLTYKALSEETGVPLSSLQRWGRRLAVSAPAFVEVVAAAGRPSGQVEVLLCSGRTLTLPAAAPFDGLAELVALLESC